MNDVWDPETQNKLVNEHAGYSDCLLVLQRVHFNVFGEVIDDCQNVLVSTLRARKRPNDVYGHAFKWRFRVDRSKCSAVARVSFVPIASRAFLTPVLDVFTDLLPVKPLFEFFDRFLNSEVASIKGPCASSMISWRAARGTTALREVSGPSFTAVCITIHRPRR